MHEQEPTMKFSSASVALVGATTLATAAGAFTLKDMLPHRADTQVAAAADSAQRAGTASAATPVDYEPGTAPNYRAIVERYGPAVVGVTVEGTRNASASDDDDEDATPAPAPRGMNPNDPFFRFFRGLPPGFGFQPPGPSPFRGEGSGFIVGADGLILTNAHVVRDAKDVTVKLQDRREYRAKVLGADTATDIAVLRIDAKNLPTVRLGDPTKLAVGDYVLAIGAPFGFEQTATQGIVSAKGRSLPGDAFVPFIQTDAAVNPGNSGGPLFDAGGNVVGINAQIYSRSGGYQGLAFAIPIDVALKVKEQIVATGSAQHARLGVTIQDLNQTLAESFGLERPDGALVSSVAAGSAAAKAGLKSGDVITKIDGTPIAQSGALSSRIGLSAPGEKVKLTVWRDKSARDLEVTLGSAKDADKVAAASPKGGAAEKGKLGLALGPPTPEERSQAQLDHGLVVEGAGGAAARAGVQPGDVLLAINGKPVSSIEQVRSTLSGDAKSVALLVLRDGEQIFVPVKLS
jgi:serine protease Do